MSLTIKVALEAVMLNNLLFQANKKVTRAHVRSVRDLICVLMKKYAQATKFSWSLVGLKLNKEVVVTITLNRGQLAKLTLLTITCCWWKRLHEG